MKKLENELISRSIKLRMRGYSFGEISSIMGFVKSTLYAYLKNIPLSPKQKECIEDRRKEKCNKKPNPRKDKCLPGREIIKPGSWSNDLVHIVAHFMFDGMVTEDGCIYYSKDKYQIDHMKRLLAKVFKAKPRVEKRDNGVYGLVFYHVELADYIKNRKEKLLSYLNNGAPKSSKRIFLRSFFDDEGGVFYKNDKRRVRGYQKSRLILGQIKDLMFSFGIEGRINNKGNNIEISGRYNLVRFAKEINFSPQIYMNPKRKNSIWKKRISKRRILALLLKAYHNN